MPKRLVDILGYRIHDDELNWEDATARWTSSHFQVRFGSVRFVTHDADKESAFSLSAWGISEALHELLADYGDDVLHEATAFLTSRQSQVVAELLNEIAHDVRRSGEIMPALEDLFIAVNVDLYLPRGLKMIVTCVTNMVMHEDDYGIEKFVAILDPGEVQIYIEERRNGQMANTKQLH